ncbi:MAG: hypothetical protein K6C12_12245 [Oscillospiraceae bacterium]|nr:hypothetical protein [Oscillospiraceae bacterium]
MLGILLLSFIPLLFLGRYDAPAGDDFSYGAEAHLAYVHSGSILEAVKAAWGQVKSSFYGWQGTWSAILLMSLQPSVFGFAWYQITPFLLIGMLAFGIFILCIRLFREVFKTGLYFGLCVGAVVTMTCVQLVPSPVQAFYWYNGAIYYTFFQGMAFLSFGIMIPLVLKESRKPVDRSVLLIFLELVLGGGNFATALCSGIVLFGTASVLILLKKKTWRRLVLPGGALLASFLANVFAPGNAYRKWTAQILEKPMGAGEAILASFGAGLKSVAAWMSLPLLGALLFLGVLFWQQLKEHREDAAFRFPVPGLVSLYSYCLLSAMFCPSYYAMGNSGPLRMTNIMWYVYVLLLAVNLYYWIGWIMTGRHGREGSKTQWVLPAAVLVSIVLCAAHVVIGKGYTSAAAFGTLHSGEAQAYYAEAKARDEVLRTDESDLIELEPFTYLPFMLYTGDLSTDPDFYANQDVALFYEKSRVVIRS